MITDVKHILQYKSIEDGREYLNAIMRFYMRLIVASRKYQPVNQAEADCIMTLQMMFTRACSFVQLLDGFVYDDGENRLNRIIDPSVLYSMARDIYEAVSSFEIVFVLPDTNEKKEIAYALYVISGLQERQQFKLQTEEAVAQLAEEKKELDEEKVKLKQMPYYLHLTDENKQLIDAKIESPHPVYRLLYGDDYSIIRIKWEDAYRLFGIKDVILGDMYNFLSMHAHPTAVSLRQYRDSFLQENPHFIEAACLASKIVAMLICVFVVDFCKKFDWAKTEYDKLEEQTQWVIDAYNLSARKGEYALSDKWK